MRTLFSAVVALAALCSNGQTIFVSDANGNEHGIDVGDVGLIDLNSLILETADGGNHRLTAGTSIRYGEKGALTISGSSPVKVVNPYAAEGVTTNISSSGNVTIVSSQIEGIQVEIRGVYGKDLYVASAGPMNLDVKTSQVTVHASGGGDCHFSIDESSQMTFIGNPGDYSYSGENPLIDLRNPDFLKGISPIMSFYDCGRLIRVSPLTKVGDLLTFTMSRAGDVNFNRTLLKRHRVHPGVNVVDLSAKKRSFIWIDAAANFKDFANSTENIARDLKLARDAGFTDIVVDVRSTTGDVLFETDVVDQVKSLNAWVNGVYGPVYRTATFDYLKAFIDEGHRLGLRVHAAMNTMVCGSRGSGLAFRDSSKRDWVTTLNTENGLKNMMDVSDELTKFFNPGHPEVVEFICSLARDLAKYEGLDGIFLDRGRYHNLQSDFSELSRAQFEEFAGVKLTNFPAQILPAGSKSFVSTSYSKRWLEYRAMTIHNLMEKVREAVKSVNEDVAFGVYVGGWYSTYYDVGVNWGSPNFDTSSVCSWATADYKKWGYADLMDQMLIGAYASPTALYGTREWSIQGFCHQAMEKIGNDCLNVFGGPDVGNWNVTGLTEQQELNGVRKSVDAAMSVADGYFLFDMIHLKQKTAKWEAVENGFADFIDALPKTDDD